MPNLKNIWPQLRRIFSVAVGTRTLRFARSEARMALIFLGLIFIPSGLLAYFSWRALENEKLFAQRRLQESYRQLARLAAREINNELEKYEKRWTSAAKFSFEAGGQPLAANRLDELTQTDALISAAFVLAAPGKVVYPPGTGLESAGDTFTKGEQESYVREHEIFTQLETAGGELEYRASDLQAAIAVYREILTKVATPQLRGMAELDIGRAQQKQGAWEEALTTFEHVLTTYPEVRDRNNTYLRFLAQYQIAVCLENLERDQEAVAALLLLNQDLLERSDAISTLQYSYFLNLTQGLAMRLIVSPQLADSADYRRRFNLLAEQSKKRISQKYFLRLLDSKLQETVIERKLYRTKFRYVADANEHEAFLLAYHFLPDAAGLYVTGVLGLQIDLTQLQERLFTAILKDLQFNEQIALAILNRRGDYVIGTANAGPRQIATHNLAAPFNFWQIAVCLPDSALPAPWSFRSTLGAWLISLLLLSILFGAYLFIRRARHEAHLSRMKSTFVSNVSHELRTPLASIKMLAELMEMQLSGKPAARLEESKARQYLSVIGRECERLGRLIDNVLDFSKIERGFKQYHFEYEEPAAVLRRAIESFRPQAEALGFKVLTEIDEHLPEVRLDADALAQVMLNLLGNAVKYSDEVKEISVRATRTPECILVEVTDRGIGIPPHDLPKIFASFYRADQRLSTQKQGGMGLGLTLAQHIVQAHGGEISVRSEVGKGSSFTFTIPLAKYETPQQNGEAQSSAAKSPVLTTGTAP
ncbi:tetratricopeptide repeat protein [candidate division KSB1 bacterium]|nr:tetratricopeptide repeat protein [candidate division KSB1 bacterium]